MKINWERLYNNIGTIISGLIVLLIGGTFFYLAYHGRLF